MPFWLLLHLFILLFNSSSVAINDTITPAQPLNDGQVLTSGGTNKFQLGFFSPGNSKRRRYVGIWYTKVTLQTVVWVANRDRPINDTDGLLSISGDGNLVLSSGTSIIWSTKISGKPKTTAKARLLDTGNLILITGAGNQTPAWQGFDYPTHVLLPGMKIGLERKTGFDRFLTSWRSADDPGQGNYSFRVDPDGGSPELFVYRDGSVPVWRTGPWVGQRWSGVPEMTRRFEFILNYSFVNNPSEVYYTYNVLNASIVSILLIDGVSGTVQRTTWHDNSRQWLKFWSAPQEDCDDYAYCGAFGLCSPNSDQFACSCFAGYQPKSLRDWYLRDGSDGCARVGNVSMCRNGEGFLKMGNVKVPSTSKSKTNASMSMEECRAECLRNCSCSAYTTATDSGGRAGGGSGGPSGCMVIHGELIDTREYPTGGGQDLYVRVDAVELAKISKKSRDGLDKKRLTIILVCTITTTVMAMTLFGYWFYRKKRREWTEEQEKSLWLKTEESDSNLDLSIFSLSAIVTATQNFDARNKLGEGGFGAVYKGTISSGQDIAVKRLSKHSGQGIDEFKNEVRLIAKLQHRNLVKTLGCCIRGDEKMLIYEFLPNMSLDKYIFDEEKRSLLDWNKRYDIILGIARGVLYLHQDSRLRIIHRDLKASNILLDATMTPKISDFGMARIFRNDQNQANTNRVVGTYGYMSPEYAMEGIFSIKSDVFSFGVVALELVTGQKSSGSYNEDLSTNLIGYIWKIWQDGKALNAVDPSILSATRDYKDEILRCIQIGLLCAQENPNERPTMLEVIFMLSNNSELPCPNEPAFITKRSPSNNGDPVSSSIETHSVNGLTITAVEAR